MKINIRDNGTYVCIEPVDRIDYQSALDFEKEVLPCIEQGRDCIIDLKSVSYISSAGLRVIMVAAKKSQGKGNKLILCHMQDMVKEVFEISGFNTILNICENIGEAES